MSSVVALLACFIFLGLWVLTCAANTLLTESNQFELVAFAGQDDVTFLRVVGRALGLVAAFKVVLCKELFLTLFCVVVGHVNSSFFS